MKQLNCCKESHYLPGAINAIAAKLYLNKLIAMLKTAF